jgi:MIP family channel proteins
MSLQDDDKQPLLPKPSSTTASGNKQPTTTTTTSNAPPEPNKDPESQQQDQSPQREHRYTGGIRSVAHSTLDRPVHYVTRSFAYAGENRLGFMEENVTTKNLLKAAMAEFWGMTLFVYFGTGAVVSTGMFLVDESGKPPVANVARIMPIATAFGISITILVFNLGHSSGGHINPAVSLALFMMQRISLARMLLYWLAQFTGAVLGSALLLGSTASISDSKLASVHGAGYPPFNLGACTLSPALSAANGLLFEIMGTMFLIFTVLYSAIDQRSFAASNLLPLPIGFTVWVVHIALIPWTGCGINPARVFGPAVVNSFAGNDEWGTTWWIYYVGPIIGTIIAVFVTRLAWEGKDPPRRDQTVPAKLPATSEAASRADLDDDEVTSATGGTESTKKQA